MLVHEALKPGQQLYLALHFTLCALMGGRDTTTTETGNFAKLCEGIPDTPLALSAARVAWQDTACMTLRSRYSTGT
ncbi:hypothetical protein ElyMa_004680600 [Elysia marginata]|uniref:Uncharacterized protein n=1 Tax=Elysia marginata TaxID=1093978 RepID=A0AAV4I4K4_9GAST|nr:hypothetical protein ElyMa_004680600 [Elysia marginata]